MKKSKDETNNVFFKIIGNWTKKPQIGPYKSIDAQLTNKNDQEKSLKPTMYINREADVSKKA